MPDRDRVAFVVVASRPDPVGGGERELRSAWFVVADAGVVQPAIDQWVGDHPDLDELDELTLTIRYYDGSWVGVRDFIAFHRGVITEASSALN